MTQIQTEAIKRRKLQESQKAKRRSQHTPASVQLLCRNCFKQVASGSDIRLLDNTHYVNINPNFKYVEPEKKLTKLVKLYSIKPPL